MTRQQPTTVERPIVRDGRRVDRELLSSIERGLDEDGCALLVGPYEVGKSDLAREIAKRSSDAAHYLNATDEQHRNQLLGDAGLVRRSVGQLLIIDEAHAFPDGLDLIRAEMETARRSGAAIGRFLLVGSTIETERLVSERFGTRAPIYRLSPIRLAELPEHAVRPESARLFAASEVEMTTPIGRLEETISMETLWMRGGFPLSLLADDEAASFAWRERYISMLCGRDYRRISESLSASSVREVLLRIAATQGEPVVVDRSHRACVDYLVDLGFLRQLRPWFPNELKRLEKNPKTYIRDTGLLHCLLNRRTHGELQSDGNTLGHSWEGFCIENLIGAAPHAQAFYYRSSDEQEEIDLLLEFSGGSRLAIEVKSRTAKLGDGYKRALEFIKPTASYVVRPVPESSHREWYREMTLSDMVNVVRAASA